MSSHATIEAVSSSRLLAIVREPTSQAAAEQVDRLANAGARAIEVSLSTPGALELVRSVADSMRARGVQFGVGTVTTPDDVEAAAAAGAAFVVSPVSSTALIEVADRLGLGSVFGVMTPTESVAAVEAGADMLKLFPATVWSPASMRELHKVFPEFPLVPTGGIGLSDAPDWFAAGATAVGLGSALRDLPSDVNLPQLMQSPGVEPEERPA